MPPQREMNSRVDVEIYFNALADGPAVNGSGSALEFRAEIGTKISRAHEIAAGTFVRF
jgi:hypothetical protein